MSLHNTELKSDIIFENNAETFDTVPIINNKVEGLTPEQKNLLKGYKDKSLIVSILAKRSYEFFSRIKTFVNVPLILSSTTLAILNSASLTGEQMKIPNVIINSITGLTLAMISNFKITEKTTVFQNVYKKMNKLNHRIEEAMINNTDNSLNVDKMSIYIKEYEALIESLDYAFPTSVKKKVYERYKGSGLTIPNALIGFDDIAITDLNANNFNGLNSV